MVSSTSTASSSTGRGSGTWAACWRARAACYVLRHQAQPFRLADSSRPGHRKILALFLVGPFLCAIGTANVPPQQKDWRAEAIREKSKLGGLPMELMRFGG